MNTRLNIDNDLLENIQIAQSDNWHFVVKLMDMLRCKEVSVSDTNMDIYKKVVGALAKDRIDEYESKKAEYDRFRKLMEGEK